MSDLDFREVTKEDWGAGEIAPSYQGRISSDLYKSGSNLMYNMLPRAGGGSRRRPGTRWVADPDIDTGTNVKQFPFSAIYGQQFMLLVCIKSSAARIYVYSVATHALVGTITTNVSAYLSADIPAITYAQTGGMTWLFMGQGAGTPGGVPVCYVKNASSDGSGAWSSTQPTFSNAGGETFAATNHYPSAGEFYAGRLFMSGTNTDPGVQWGCTIPAPPAAQTYLIFLVGSATAIDGIFLRQNDLNASFIRFLVASQKMLMGTDRSVWMEQDENYPTPATYAFKKCATYGALAYSRPVQAGNVILYLGVDTKTFRYLSLSEQRGYYSDFCLSDQAEHLMSRAAVDFTVTMRPDPIAWIYMADGSMVSASVRQKDNGYTIDAGCGFAQHSIGGSGLVKSAISLENTAYSELWLAVKRGTTISIEYLYLDDINSTPQASTFHVDCGATKTGPGTVFTGLPTPLQSQSVAGFGDGAVLPRVTATAGGQVTYAYPITTLQVGFPYFTAWQDLRAALPGKGGLLGLLRKVEKEWMLVYNSMGGWIGKDAPSDPLNNPGETLTSFWPEMQTYGVQQYGAAPPWVNGFISVDDALASDANGQVYIAIVDPVPFNLVAVTTRYALSEI